MDILGGLSMKVKDLIKELKWCDQDLEIFVHFLIFVGELRSKGVINFFVNFLE